MPYNWIDKLQESNNKTHKENVIGEAYTACKLGSQDACIFLKFVSTGFNPFLNFYTKEVSKSSEISTSKNAWNFLEFLLEDLSSRRITGNNATNQIHELKKSFDSENWNKIVRPLLLKNFRLGITRQNLNNILKDTEYEVPEFKCMEPSDSSENKSKLFGLHFVQRKLKGVRVVAVLKLNEIELYSSDGHRLTDFKHIERSLRLIRDEFYRALPFLYDPLLVDGHIILDDFDDLMLRASRKQFKNTENAKFHIFDYCPWDDFQNGGYAQSYDDRLVFLDAVKDKLTNINNLEIEEKPVLIDLSSDNGLHDLDEYTRECNKNGFDGVILKRIHSQYTCRKSTAWLTYNLDRKDGTS